MEKMALSTIMIGIWRTDCRLAIKHLTMSTICASWNAKRQFWDAATPLNTKWKTAILCELVKTITTTLSIKSPTFTSSWIRTRACSRKITTTSHRRETIWTWFRKTKRAQGKAKTKNRKTIRKCLSICCQRVKKQQMLMELQRRNRAEEVAATAYWNQWGLAYRMKLRRDRLQLLKC